jgi:hypothetical protein
VIGDSNTPVDIARELPGTRTERDRLFAPDAWEEVTAAMAVPQELAFPGPRDRVTRGVTIGLTVFVAAIAIVLAVVGAVLWGRSAAGGAALLAGAMFCGLLWVIPARLAPRGYTIGPEGVTIRRRARDIVIPLATIRGVEIDAQGKVLRKAVRMNGSGGGFGVFGYFDKPGFGYYRAYCTRTSALVILRLADREPLAISPEDPTRFAAALAAMSSRGG